MIPLAESPNIRSHNGLQIVPETSATLLPLGDDLQDTGLTMIVRYRGQLSESVRAVIVTIVKLTPITTRNSQTDSRK